MSPPPSDGRLYVIAGASRSGKTAWTIRETRAQKRLIAWDVEDHFSQLPGWQRISTQSELLAACSKPGPAKIAFVPGPGLQDRFNFWAWCVMRWGSKYGGCHAIADELADVSTQGKAPGNWGILLRRGLKRGIYIYAISQRWAEADKTAVGNASEFICFRMSSGDDIAYMSKKTRIPKEQLEGLQRLEFVRYDTAGGPPTRGKLTFR